MGERHLAVVTWPAPSLWPSRCAWPQVVYRAATIRPVTRFPPAAIWPAAGALALPATLAALLLIKVALQGRQPEIDSASDISEVMDSPDRITDGWPSEGRAYQSQSRPSRHVRSADAVELSPDPRPTSRMVPALTT